MIQIVDKIELMILTGYTDAQASKLIRKAKQKLLQDGFEWYGNKKVGRVPLKTISNHVKKLNVMKLITVSINFIKWDTKTKSL